MSKCRVFMTRKSKSLYWTLFWPKYWAAAGDGASIRPTATAATTNDRRARRNEGMAGLLETWVSRCHQCVTERSDAGPRAACVESAACRHGAAGRERADPRAPVVCALA